MPLPTGELQAESSDAIDGARMWTAQWAETPYQMPFPGYKTGEGDLPDPRPDYPPTPPPVQVVGGLLPTGLPMSIGAST